MSASFTPNDKTTGKQKQLKREDAQGSCAVSHLQSCGIETTGPCGLGPKPLGGVLVLHRTPLLWSSLWMALAVGQMCV